MLKLALQKGLHFEIAYSPLISTDVNAKRNLIAEVKVNVILLLPNDPTLFSLRDNALLSSENHLFSDIIWYIQLLYIYNNTFHFQLLVDWTKGKNLIISSAAHTASQIRGPYDVINLSAYLLGIPIDRAKAAMSSNCR